MRIEIARLEKLYGNFAQHYGADEEEAKLFTRCMLRADLRGHTTQGIGLLPYLAELFTTEMMFFGRQFELVRESAATALVDGHRGVGQVIGTRAMDIAINKARNSGIGLVTVRNSSDFGMASNYAIQALEQGLIGISMSTGPLLVAPWGGRDAWFSTNPLAIAVPAGEEDPIVIDMATSANSMGSVVLAARDDKKLNGNEVVDSDGHYSNDPRSIIEDVMDRESGMSGALLPAGPKGFGMLLLVELLSGLLSGERTWEDGIPADSDQRPAYYAQTFIAISIENFQDPAEFSKSADRMVANLTSARPAKGFEQVRLHGSGAAETMRESEIKGVFLRDEEWDMVTTLAESIGISTA